ncbi:MAG: conjugal transfer protein TraD [Rhodocyclaceae bacterium]|nr:MAG: conjugal transfer protein TraD [Rhodocyclaceae bacterium]
MSDPFLFELQWRKNFELRSAIVWFGAAIATLLVSLAAPQPKLGLGPAVLCLGFGVMRGYVGYRREMTRGKMAADGIEFISIDEFTKKAQAAIAKQKYWIGKGFAWTDIEATKLHGILGEGAVKVLGETAKKSDGAWWLHGLGDETDLESELSNQVGHTIVVGTTRVGKSRYADLQIAQGIIRNEATFIFDPKNEGMRGLAGNAKRMCEAMGCPERFVYFNFAFPEESVRIDPLRNWASPTELPSRISTLIPSETGNDAFTSFAWDMLNAETLGMLAIGEKPTLKRYRYYTENGIGGLLLEVLNRHMDATQPSDWEANVIDWAKQRGMGKKRGESEGEIIPRQATGLLLQYYTEVIAAGGCESEAANALAVVHRHPGEHTAKMIANLRPILTKLTTGVLGELLSPDPMDVADPRPMVDMQSLITSRAVVYFGLNALADSAVGSAIGSMLLADLASVAGSRQNYQEAPDPINVHIDEAVECLNEPTVQLMNKGGSSGFQVTLYTQTFADFAARLGSEYKARQILGNANNRITFRVLDAETQKYIVDGIPPFKVKSMGIRYGQNVDPRIHDEFSASYQEQMTSEEADLFPAAMLGDLPKLHYIARLSGGRMLKGRIPILQTN